MDPARTTFERQGFAILPSIISAAECDELVGLLDSAAFARSGSRRLLSMAPFARIATMLGRQPVIQSLLPEQASPVQCTLFAKLPGSNWSVTAHQDLSIPVQERRDTPGWSGWSKKEGVWFVQPPVAVLQQLLAVRLQLDPHSSDTGPLEVVPGTHKSGRLAHAEILRSTALGKFHCIVPRGGALLMRPLLVHASSKSKLDRPRRVLHFLFGAPLPAGFDWATST